MALEHCPAPAGSDRESCSNPRSPTLSYLLHSHQLLCRQLPVDML